MSNLISIHTSVETISGPTNLIEGRGRAPIVLPNGTEVTIAEALYSPRSSRTLLSFKDIRASGYHVETKIRERNGISLQNL